MATNSIRFQGSMSRYHDELMNSRDILSGDRVYALLTRLDDQDTKSEKLQDSRGVQILKNVKKHVTDIGKVLRGKIQDIILRRGLLDNLRNQANIFSFKSPISVVEFYITSIFSFK